MDTVANAWLDNVAKVGAFAGVETTPTSKTLLPFEAGVPSSGFGRLCAGADMGNAVRDAPVAGLANLPPGAAWCCNITGSEASSSGLSMWWAGLGEWQSGLSVASFAAFFSDAGSPVKNRHLHSSTQSTKDSACSASRKKGFSSMVISSGPLLPAAMTTMYSARTLASSCSPHMSRRRSSTAAWKEPSSVAGGAVDATARCLGAERPGTETETDPRAHPAAAGALVTRRLFETLLRTSTGEELTEEPLLCLAGY